jgi:hypothetical protein
MNMVYLPCINERIFHLCKFLKFSVYGVISWYFMFLYAIISDIFLFNGLQLVDSKDLHTLTSRVVGTTGLCHHTQICKWYNLDFYFIIFCCPNILEFWYVSFWRMNLLNPVLNLWACMALPFYYPVSFFSDHFYQWQNNCFSSPSPLNFLYILCLQLIC